MSAPDRRRAPELWLAGFGLLAALVVWAFEAVPQATLPENIPADVLLVLGSPAETDGSVTPAERWRVEEAVREFRAGRAPFVLFTGGPAANRFVEAQVMAAYAQRLGVPGDRVLEETHARTTVENIANSQRVMLAHGWRRVEVISSPEHLHRAAYLMARTPFLWRVHAAATPGRSRWQSAGAFAEEAVGTAAFQVFGPRAEPVVHALARAQHAVFVAVRWVVHRGTQAGGV